MTFDDINCNLSKLLSNNFMFHMESTKYVVKGQEEKKLGRKLPQKKVKLWVDPTTSAASCYLILAEKKKKLS